MAEELQGDDPQEPRRPLKLAIISLFLIGLFLLTVGVGLSFIGSEKESDIKIISSDSAENSPAKIIVHVDGEVTKPGVYEFESGARINDAVVLAGGVTDAGDLSKLNLAQKLADGQKIYVPAIGEVTPAFSEVSGVSTGLVNINTASVSQLDTLPQIGSARAQDIVAGRPYSSVEELLSKKVVGSSVYEQIKDLVTY